MNQTEPSNQYCLRWNNHRTHILTTFDHLLQTESFTDVTLACDGASIKCHKMVLAACSSYFQNLFLQNSCKHPIVVLKDIRYNELKNLLEFMYKGEVNILQDELDGLLKLAENLKVKGLVEDGKHTAAPWVSTQAPTPATNNSYLGDQPPFPRGASLTTGGSSSSSSSAAQMSQGIPHTAQHDSVLAHLRPSSQDEPLNLDMPYEKRMTTNSKPSAAYEEGYGNTHPILRNVLGVGHVHQEQQSPPDLPHDLAMKSQPPDEALGDSWDDVKKEKIPGSFKLHPGKPPFDSALENSPLRLEWKRYKLYDQKALEAAIQDVSMGVMGAPTAAKKYGIPSRTLYARMKKLGIPTAPRRFNRFPSNANEGEKPSVSFAGDTSEDASEDTYASMSGSFLSPLTSTDLNVNAHTVEEIKGPPKKRKIEESYFASQQSTTFKPEVPQGNTQGESQVVVKKEEESSSTNAVADQASTSPPQ